MKRHRQHLGREKSNKKKKGKRGTEGKKNTLHSGFVLVTRRKSMGDHGDPALFKGRKRQGGKHLNLSALRHKEHITH